MNCIDQFIPTPTPTPTPTSTILVYNIDQGSSFDWNSDGYTVTFTLDINLANYSYTSIMTSIPASLVPIRFRFNLIKVIIGNTVTTICNSVFAGCIYLTSITISDSVTSIGNNAFSDCYRLKSITIPDSVTSIGIDAFNECTNLTTIFISNTQAVLLGNQLGYDWTSSTSPGIYIKTPEFYSAPGNVIFRLP